MLTDSLVSVYAGELDGPIVSLAWILFVLFVFSIGAVAIGQSIVDKVDFMRPTSTKTSEEVGAFHVSMNVLRLMKKLQRIKLCNIVCTCVCVFTYERER